MTNKKLTCAVALAVLLVSMAPTCAHAKKTWLVAVSADVVEISGTLQSVKGFSWNQLFDFEEATKYPEKGITGKGRYGRVGDDNEMIATIFPLKSDVVEDLYLLWWRKP